MPGSPTVSDPPRSPSSDESSDKTTRGDAVHAWLTGTVAGRMLAAGAALKLTALAGRFVGTAGPIEMLDTLADVCLVAGAAAVGYRVSAGLKRRMLWRVRRKLTLSYIFIGFVPALLIITFFLLSGLLLFFSVSSYMLRTRVGSVIDEIRFLAQSAAIELQQAPDKAALIEVLARRQAAAVARYPLASYAVAPWDRLCEPAGRARKTAPVSTGPWLHAPAPVSVPVWVPCDGYAGLVPFVEGDLTLVVARAVARPDGAAYAVVVDVPLGRAMTRQIREDTGITIREITRVEFHSESVTGDRDNGQASSARGVPPEWYRSLFGPPNLEPGAGSLMWVTVLDSTDWATGRRGTMTVGFSLVLSDVWNRIDVPLGRLSSFSLGQTLLIALALVGSLFLMIQAIAFVMGLALARSITGSVHELFAGTERVRRGDFTYKIPIRSRDQLGDLADSFNTMTASIGNLLQEKAEKERLEQELRIARSIQMSLLPRGPLTMPGLTLTAHCEPAREVGGDYYDFLPVDDHTVGVLVADVSGKGTSAALYMAELKGIVLSLSQQHTSPRQLLIDANRIISRHLDTRSFITMTYLLVDLRARMLRYARAGHCPLIYVPADDRASSPLLAPGPGVAAAGRARILLPDGMVLGLQLDDGRMFDALLAEMTLPLGSGDLFLLYTDGLSEAMSPAGDVFGDARLAELVERHADLPPDELRERILREVHAFAGVERQQDDMTMVVLKVA